MAWRCRPWASDFRDYDNDGQDDLFITALSNETFPLFRNLGGHFGDVTYPAGIGKTSYPWSGWSCGMFDFNNDGYKDVFTANGHVMDNEELTSSRQSRQPNTSLCQSGQRHVPNPIAAWRGHASRRRLRRFRS